MNRKLHTSASGSAAVFLALCMSFMLYACSSENKPIAEVFLGDWTIFSKTGSNAGNIDITGEMNIDFGNDIIVFEMNFEDDTENYSLAGIVHDSSLYTDSSRETLLGKLEIANGILCVTLEEYAGVVFNARKS